MGIVSDGWSFGILLKELKDAYEAYKGGSAPTLLPLAIQYADFALWQRRWLQGDVLDKQLEYWKNSLSGAPEEIALPTDYVRPYELSYRGGVYTHHISKELLYKIKVLGEKEGATLFMTLLGALQVLLSRYSGQEDIVIGSPIANRNYKEIEGLIGFFINTLALRGHITGDLTFRDILNKTKEITLDAYAHQDVPFEQLVDHLQITRRINSNPVFQVVFVLQNTSNADFVLEGVEAQGIDAENTVSKFDLSVFARENNDSLILGFEYAKDLFKAETIERLAKHFIILLEEIVHAPDQEINHHNFLTAEERQQILVEWNQTDADYPKDKTIHQLFEEQVDKTPDNIALVYEDTTLTYRELNNRANQLAHYLKKHHDIRPDTLIALCLDRSEHMLVAILAVLKSGGAYVPIDPNYPEERIAYILEDTKTKVVITNETYEEKLIKISSAMLSAELEQLSVLAIDCIKTRIQLSAQPELDLKTSTTSINLAYVIYTSGTTGKPKGVMIEHISYTSVVHCMKNLYFSHTQNISTYSITNYVFDIFGLEYGIPLFSGGIIYIGFRELSTLDCQKFDFIQMTPSVCDLILDCLINTSHLKLFVGGDTLSRELLSKLLNKFINIVNVYGPTETTIWSTSGICSELEDQNSLSVNLGKPLSNESTYILSTALTPLPIGAIGELYIGGLGLARGYLNQPDLTIERFIPNPFRTEEEKLDKRYGPNEKNARLYRTGDLARYLPDGNIEYLGRIDEQVKIRGYRIEPGEIENVLNGYKDVRSSIVLAREEDGSKRLVAYIVPDEEKKTSLLTQSSFKSSSGEVISIFGGDNLPIILEHIRNHVSKQLPDYMIPSFFVLIDKLPLTSNGKVDKKSLPSPDVSLSITSSYVAPRNEIERKLCTIWSEVLGIENIGINENFFEIGGHSLLSLSLFAKIKKVFLQKFL